LGLKINHLATLNELKENKLFNAPFSIQYFRHGAVDITSASVSEDPGLNPARVYGFKGKHINAAVFH
jgi:hypothetical protein